VRRFAPDLDELPTVEIPDLRRKAQGIIHLLVGPDISPEEYVEKLEHVQTLLTEVYQEAVAVTAAQHSWKVTELESQLQRVTHRPRKSTYPGVGPPTIPPPPALPKQSPLPEIDIDWSDLEDV